MRRLAAVVVFHTVKACLKRGLHVSSGSDCALFFGFVLAQNNYSLRSSFNDELSCFQACLLMSLFLRRCNLYHGVDVCAVHMLFIVIIKYRRRLESYHQGGIIPLRYSEPICSEQLQHAKR